MRRVCTLTAALLLLAAMTPVTAQQPVKPGPEHEMLKQHEGTWEATIKSSAGDSKGTLTCKAGLGGLWVLEHFQGDFGGMAFEGRGAITYDPAKKKYVSIWIDSMSTSPAVSEGTYDKATKTMTMVGDMPMPDGKSMKMTMIAVTKDADTKHVTMRCAGPDGKDFEMMQINYKRRAK
jgi:hypothetical protein